MDRFAASKALRSARPSERLAGARFFARSATTEDVPVLRNAIARETTYWVKAALLGALRAAGQDVPEELPEDQSVAHGQGGWDFDQQSEAVARVAGMFLHELRPVVGRLDVFAAQTIPDYSESLVKRQVESLQLKLVAIERLARAAAVPTQREFELPALVRRVVADTQGEGVDIKLAGTEPLTVVSDEGLIELVVSQGLRNAVELSGNLEAPKRAVLVTWGATDRDYWIRVVDNGGGPLHSLQELATWGRSTKAGHMGYGLAIALRAARSLQGSLELVAREQGGGAYHFRWAK